MFYADKYGSNPVQRFKSGWIQNNARFVEENKEHNADFALVGDSIVPQYPDVLNRYFKPPKVIHHWRFGLLPLNVKMNC